MKMNDNMGFSTKQIHAGYEKIYLEHLQHQYIKHQHSYLTLLNKVEEDLLYKKMDTYTQD